MILVKTKLFNSALFFGHFRLANISLYQNVIIWIDTKTGFSYSFPWIRTRLFMRLLSLPISIHTGYFYFYALSGFGSVGTRYHHHHRCHHLHLNLLLLFFNRRKENFYLFFFGRKLEKVPRKKRCSKKKETIHHHQGSIGKHRDQRNELKLKLEITQYFDISSYTTKPEYGQTDGHY